MLREISDIVSESITIHLKGSVVKSTAKQKDFQSKIKMFRKKIAALKESFIPVDKLIADLKRIFVTATKKIVNKEQETYVDKIYKHVDVVEKIKVNEEKCRAVLVQIKQTFSNYDQSSVKSIIEDTNKLIEDRIKERDEAEALLHELTGKVYPKILEEKQDSEGSPSNIVAMVRHYFKTCIKRLNRDLENKIVMEKESDLFIMSDKYTAHGRKGVMWTRYIKFENLPTIDGPIDTFLAITAILFDPNPERDGSLEIPNFNMGSGLDKLTLSFISKKVRPARLNLDLKTAAVRVIGEYENIKRWIPVLCKRNNINLFPKKEKEIAITIDQIKANEEDLMDQYNEYEAAKETINEDLIDLELDYESKVDSLTEDIDKQIKTLSSKVKEDDAYIKLQKDIKLKKEEIIDSEKATLKFLKVKTLDDKEKIVNDYLKVAKYEAKSEEAKVNTKPPSDLERKNYSRYLKYDGSHGNKETELLNLKQELKDLQNKSGFTMENIKNDILRETISAKDKLKKQFEISKNKLLLKVEKPKVSIYFDDAIKKRRFEGGIKLFFPLDFPETIDSYLTKELNQHNNKILELEKDLQKVQKNVVYSEDEFVNWRNKLYANQRSSLVKQLNAQEKNATLDKPQRTAVLRKFETDFELKTTIAKQLQTFLDEKAANIKAEIEEHKTARAKLSLNALDVNKAKRDFDKDGQAILSTKKVKSLPSERWESNLTKEMYYVFGLKSDYNEGTTSKSKNAGRLHLHREITPFIPIKQQDNKKYKATDMYCYTFTLLPKEDVEEEEENNVEINPILPEIDLSLDSLQESLDSLSRSGNVTISDKEVEIGERKVLDNSQKINIWRYNKKWMEDHPDTTPDFDDDGKMIPMGSGKKNKLKVSDEWDDEDKPETILRKKPLKQKREKVINFNKYKGGG